MILVTGATGFVGYHLVNALVGRHKRVRCLVQTDEAKTRGIANDIEIVKGDIRDKDVVNNALKGVQQVVHLASVIENPNLEIVRQINAEGTKNLVQASLLCGVEQFIFFSTLNVILPVKNQYSMSKLEAEGIIKKSGLSFIILRPSIIYGRGDNGTIEKLISTVKTKKLVFLVGEGKYMLQPVFVDDVVRAVCEVLNNPHKFENRALFLVGKEIVSYNDLVDLISNIITTQVML